MINKIRAYKCNMTKGFLGRKNYTKVEITKQLEMPIYDTTQLDGVLDTTQISLLNRTQEPLKPFTRIIIELYEDDELIEKIYRVVDNDSVSNVVRGSKPIYRHTVSLVEITKILERRAVDNLTFTNYLSNNTNSDMAVNYSSINNKSVGGELKTARYVNNNRFYGPYHILGYNDSISTDIRLNVTALANRQILFFPISPVEVNIELKSFDVILPNGTAQSLVNTNYFTYSQIGVYKFQQRYYYKNTDGYEFDFSFVWRIECVNSVPKINKYNMYQVVERILKCHKTLLNDRDTQEFYLDSNISDKLSNIEAPEFAITQGTLFEALEQVGKYFNAIPRLIPQVNGDDDYSNWNVITFDFLDNLTERNVGTYSLIDLENPSEEYATDFVSNIQNATISNYSGKSSTFEPCKNGYLSTRTESAVYEVSDNECMFKTRDKIRAIVKATLLYQGQEHDITDRVVEKSLYNLKASYKADNVYDQKDHFLYYTQGEKNIYGLQFTKTVLDSDVVKGYKTEAIKNLITGFGDGNIKDIAINIEYIPFVDFKVKQYKTHIDGEAEDSTLYYNQQSNEVDIEAYGENMHFALNKTGNVKVAKTQYFKHFDNIPKLGQYIKDGNDKYVVFQSNREIITHCPMKCTTAFSKNYQQLFAQIAIKSAIRQFEISERESIERNIDIQDFCVVDTELDLDKFYNGNFNDNTTQEEKTEIKEILRSGFGHPNNCNALVNHFSKTSGITERLSSAVICRLKYPERIGYPKNILCPASVYAFGRSIICRFTMEDNFSAGTFIDTIKTGKEDVDCGDDSVIERPAGNYAIENHIRYCDEYGKLEYLEFALIDKFNTDDNWVKQSSSYYLYNLDGDNEHYFKSKYRNAYVYFGYADNNYGALIVDKDSREKISVTCQLNFVTTNQNINIHKAMVDTLPYICDSETTYKFVIFEQEQNGANDFIVGNYDIIGNVNAVYNQSTGSIKLSANGTTNCNGKAYGIVANDNRLCVSVNKEIVANEQLKPIHFMFRHKV